VSRQQSSSFSFSFIFELFSVIDVIPRDVPGRPRQIFFRVYKRVEQVISNGKHSRNFPRAAAQRLQTSIFHFSFLFLNNIFGIPRSDETTPFVSNLFYFLLWTAWRLYRDSLPRKRVKRLEKKKMMISIHCALISLLLSRLDPLRATTFFRRSKLLIRKTVISSPHHQGYTYQSTRLWTSLPELTGDEWNETGGN
jgi:hypothetical protein